MFLETTIKTRTKMATKVGCLQSTIRVLLHCPNAELVGEGSVPGGQILASLHDQLESLLPQQVLKLSPGLSESEIQNLYLSKLLRLLYNW